MIAYTLGHSNRTWDDFLGLLREHDIRLLVDIRRFPGSRKHPHFGGPALAAALPLEGVAYAHAVDLGGRRAPVSGSPNGHWREASFRAYADWMASDDFRAAFAALVAQIPRQPTAILCAEAVPWRCHRQLVADALVARGVEVRHVLGPGSVRVHTLNPAARVRPDGVIVYPPADPGLFDSA